MAREKTLGKSEDLGLPDSVVQLSFAVHWALARVADRHELSLPQVRVLGILRGREPSMLELASFLELDKSSVTGLITRAENRGLVKRLDVPGDRRAVHVTLTSKGRTIAQTFAKEFAAELAALLVNLSERERAQLSTLASKVALDDMERRPHLTVKL